MWEGSENGSYKVNRTHGDLLDRVVYGDPGESVSTHATSLLTF